MKRYWLFSYEKYYPGGGMNDFVDSFDTIEEAQAWKPIEYGYRDFLDIVDSVSGEVVSISGARDEYDDFCPEAREWRAPVASESKKADFRCPALTA